MYLARMISTYAYNTEYRPDQYVFVCILYVYTYMNTYRYVHFGTEDLRLSRRSRAQVVRQMHSESEAGLEPRLRVYPRDTVTSKQKREVTLPKPTLVRCRRRKGPG